MIRNGDVNDDADMANPFNIDYEPDGLDDDLDEEED